MACSRGSQQRDRSGGRIDDSTRCIARSLYWYVVEKSSLTFGTVSVEFRLSSHILRYTKLLNSHHLYLTLKR